MAEITTESPNRCALFAERIGAGYASLRPLPASPRNLNPVILVLYRERGPLFPRQIAATLTESGLAPVSTREVRAALRWLREVDVGETLLAGAVARDAAGRYCLTPAGRQMLRSIPLEKLSHPESNGRRRG